MKALIKVGYGCNEHCTFCHTLDVRHIDGSSDEVAGKIRRAKALGHSMVVLSGGEPTIRPELLSWASLIAKLGMQVGLVTNGQMLAYPEFVDKLIERGLAYVYMSFHGGTPKVHNRLTRADGFERSAQAIKNLSGRGLDFSLNTVVTKQNLDELTGVVDHVLPIPDVTLKFSGLQPKGGGLHLFDMITPRISEVAQKVCEAIAYGQAKVAAAKTGPRFAHDGIPLCLLPGVEDLYDDLKTHQFATMVDIGEPDFFPVDDRAKVQPAVCDPCALRGPCPGLYRGYHERKGGAELVPVLGHRRSNSFNYVSDAVVGTMTNGTCPILADGVTPWDRGRHMFVKTDARIERFRTVTRDFSDAELSEIKHDTGQIYIDVSAKDAPDDFAKDLQKLTRSTVCTGCPEEKPCTGLFEPEATDVFTRDDHRVRDLIAGLSGDVLDVGCGEGRYAELFESLVKAKTVRYLGVDPDEGHIQTLRARLPWATLECSAAEDLDVAGQFDHVLLLRSWNHLRDLERALAKLHAALRPGGSLVVVDNVAFGLVRTAEQAERGEGSRAEFEHYRNDSAGQADAIIAAAGFSRVDRVDVTPTTSNQWLLRYTASDSRPSPDRA